MKYILSIFSALILLSGCAIKQDINMEYTPSQQAARSNGISIETTVIDNRPFVKNGNKKPSYLGHYRALLGNPWDVNNFKNIPLADQISSDLETELSSLGYTNSQSNPNLRLSVSINDWNFDTYRNGRFWYNLHVTLINSKGKTLQNFTIAGEKVIQAEGGLGGSKRSFEKTIPMLYKDIINSIANNPAHPLPR